MAGRRPVSLDAAGETDPRKPGRPSASAIDDRCRDEPGRIRNSARKMIRRIGREGGHAGVGCGAPDTGCLWRRSAVERSKLSPSAPRRPRRCGPGRTARERGAARPPGAPRRGARTSAEDDQQPGDPGHRGEAKRRSARGATFRGSTMPGAAGSGSSARGPRRGSRARRARPARRASRETSGRSRRRAVMRDGPPRAPARVGHRRRAPHAWLERSVEARFRRSERDAERDGDLRQRQVEVVMQDDERPRLRLEPAEAALELVAVGHRRLGHRRPGGRSGQVDFEALAPQAARLVDAGVDRAVGGARRRSGRGHAAWAGPARPGRASPGRRPSPGRDPGG